MRNPRHDWPRIFTHQKESGLSVAAYCSIHKISTSSFYLNKQKLSKKGDFVEAKVVSRVSEQTIQVTNAVPPPIITLRT